MAGFNARRVSVLILILASVSICSAEMDSVKLMGQCANSVVGSELSIGPAVLASSEPVIYYLFADSTEPWFTYLASNGDVKGLIKNENTGKYENTKQSNIYRLINKDATGKAHYLVAVRTDSGRDVMDVLQKGLLPKELDGLNTFPVRPGTKVRVHRMSDMTVPSNCKIAGFGYISHSGGDGPLPMNGPQMSADYFRDDAGRGGKSLEYFDGNPSWYPGCCSDPSAVVKAKQSFEGRLIDGAVITAFGCNSGNCGYSHQTSWAHYLAALYAEKHVKVRGKCTSGDVNMDPKYFNLFGPDESGMAVRLYPKSDYYRISYPWCWNPLWKHYWPGGKRPRYITNESPKPKELMAVIQAVSDDIDENPLNTDQDYQEENEARKIQRRYAILLEILDDTEKARIRPVRRHILGLLGNWGLERAVEHSKEQDENGFRRPDPDFPEIWMAICQPYTADSYPVVYREPCCCDEHKLYEEETQGRPFKGYEKFEPIQVTQLKPMLVAMDPEDRPLELELITELPQPFPKKEKKGFLRRIGGCIKKVFAND